MEKKGHHYHLRWYRYSEGGLYYFVTTTTYNRERLFLDAKVAGIVIDGLKWLNKNGRIGLITYMIMPDHLHVIFELKKDSTSRVMHSLKSFTANEINKVLDRRRQVWEKQYYEHAIRNDKELMKKVKYCLENPVRGGLVDDFREYPFWHCIYEV